MLLNRIASSPVLSLVLVALFAFAAAAAVKSAWPAAPQTHDEFSYLLAADTFAQGRLANDPHPLWEHFESFHILQQPTYGSKYPPLQGLILAVGQVLGDPGYGIWLSFAFACAALCWMLRAWVGEVWGLTGALIAALHPQLVTIWGTWLWGGAAPLAGGALVYGAVPRMLARARARDAVMFVAGAAILVFTRPYEGFAACLPAALLLLRGLRTAPFLSAPGAPRRLAPAIALFVVAVSFFALYNLRTTGHPTTLAYSVYDDTYASVPAFLFMQELPPKTYRHEPMRAYFAERGFQSAPYHERRSFEGFWRGVGAKFSIFFRFFALYALPLPLLTLPFVIGEPRVRFALFSLLWFGVALSVETYEQRHYAAPILPLALFLWITCVRHLFCIRVDRRPLGAVLVAIVLIVGFVEHAATAGDLLTRRERSPLIARPKIIEELNAQGGKHLVMVRYAADHNVHTEWVYNEADIASASVVWARELSTASNRALFKSFAGRRVWLLTPDELGSSLRPYPHT